MEGSTSQELGRRRQWASWRQHTPHESAPLSVERAPLPCPQQEVHCDRVRALRLVLFQGGQFSQPCVLDGGEPLLQREDRGSASAVRLTREAALSPPVASSPPPLPPSSPAPRGAARSRRRAGLGSFGASQPLWPPLSGHARPCAGAARRKSLLACASSGRGRRESPAGSRAPSLERKAGQWRAQRLRGCTCLCPEPSSLPHRLPRPLSHRAARPPPPAAGQGVSKRTG